MMRITFFFLICFASFACAENHVHLAPVEAKTRQQLSRKDEVNALVSRGLELGLGSTNDCRTFFSFIVQEELLPKTSTFDCNNSKKVMMDLIRSIPETSIRSRDISRIHGVLAELLFSKLQSIRSEYKQLANRRVGILSSIPQVLRYQECLKQLQNRLNPFDDSIKFIKEAAQDIHITVPNRDRRDNLFADIESIIAGLKIEVEIAEQLKQVLFTIHTHK